MADLGTIAQGVALGLAPEIMVPTELANTAKEHAGTIMMLPLVGFSILMIIIGIIVFSSMSSKLPGTFLIMLGMLVGGGAFFVMMKSEGKHK